MSTKDSDLTHGVNNDGFVRSDNIYPPDLISDGHDECDGNKKRYGDEGHDGYDGNKNTFGGEDHVDYDRNKERYGDEGHDDRDGNKKRYGDDDHDDCDGNKERYGDEGHDDCDGNKKRYGDDGHDDCDGNKKRYGDEGHDDRDGNKKRYGDDGHDDCDGNKKRYGDEPPAKTTTYVILLTFLCALGSFLFGYDTGVVSGAMLYITDEFGLTELYHELVISVTVGAAAIFAIVGGFINDLLGRKPTTLIASVVFLVGALVLGLSQNVEMLLIGRVIVGIGIGLDSMTVPMYVAECAPSHVRGRLVTVHQFMVTVGLLVSTFVDGAFSCVDQGWRYMLGLAGVPALIQLIGFLFMPESPRWLVYHDKYEQALLALQKIRGTALVHTEFQLIKDTVNEDRKQQKDNEGFVLWRMLKTTTTRRALVVGCTLQMFQQLAGINTVMYYTASIVRMAGFRDKSLAIWLSSAVSAVNTIFTLVGIYFVEKLGRKPLLIVSFIGVFLSLIVLAVGFHLPSVFSPDLNIKEGFNETVSCYSYSNCYPCSQDHACGYCYDWVDGVASNGSCVPVVEMRKPDHQAAIGRCNSTPFPQGLRFDYEFCPTDYSWLPILGMVCYLASFAPGFAPMPWTLNSEMYPLWARSAGNACATSVNWLFNLLVSQTFLTLMDAITPYGVYWLFSGISLIGITTFILIVPETKGKSLEEIERLFSKGWLHCPCTGEDNSFGFGKQKSYELESSRE